MAVVVVVVGTDHEDKDEAVRSVRNSMERAGYNFVDYVMEPGGGAVQWVVASSAAMIEVVEPEADKR